MKSDRNLIRSSVYPRAVRALLALSVVAFVGIANPTNASADDGTSPSLLASYPNVRVETDSPDPQCSGYHRCLMGTVVNTTSTYLELIYDVSIDGTSSVNRIGFTPDLTNSDINTEHIAHAPCAYTSSNTCTLNGWMVARIDSNSSWLAQRVIVASGGNLSGIHAALDPYFDLTHYQSDYSAPATPQDPPPTGTGNTCVLNDAALVRMARGAGFTDAALQKAVAIALAESGGQVAALNFNPPNPGSWDIGVWQINDDAHPTYDRNLLFTSPGENALAAYEISGSGTDFTPWVTFNSGAYNQFMTRAAVAIQQAPSGELGGNSCADLSGGDLVGSTGGSAGDGTTNDDGSDNGCGFTLNPFTATKCALKWAFVPSQDAINGWQTKSTEIQSSGAVSLVTGLTGYINYTTDEFSTCHDFTCHTGNGFVEDSDRSSLLSLHVCQTQQMDCGVVITPLTDARHMVQDNTWGQVLYGAMKFIIILGFVFYWYNRITTSVGSKEAL